MAREAERLGYRRFWVSEHHNAHCLAGSSPEVLLAAIGAATEEMRIGSGGVMLPYYSPFKVAESFAVLTNLYPDRVDLGVGRAPGGDMKTARMLAPRRGSPVRAVPRTRRTAGGDPAEQGLRAAGYAAHPFSAPRLDARVQSGERDARRPVGPALQFRPLHQQQHRFAHPRILPALLRALRPSRRNPRPASPSTSSAPTPRRKPNASPSAATCSSPASPRASPATSYPPWRKRKSTGSVKPRKPFWTTSSAWRPWAVRTRSGTPSTGLPASSEPKRSWP